jgi:tetratricopeptide (TPR) repeat protein
MTSLNRALLLVVATLVFGNSAAAQHGDHRHDPSEKLGRVNFTVSCTPQAQKLFNRAVAWLHSFEYEEAEKAFTEVAATDPRCGMAHWGVAMSNYHPLWAAPTAAELKRGWDAIEKAKLIGAGTQRERDYIAALELFYKDAATLDHRTRSFAYHEAMKRLYESNQSDSEAGVFYALTLIATGVMSNDKTYVREKEAAQILNRILKRQPQHPGVSHYLIHSYDYPALAQLALPAARSYAKIAPASAHAQHMPSHIFIRLGLWQEAIRSNLDAEASAKAFARRHKMAGAWDEQLHAMDYLAYAYLQSAQDKLAWGVLDEMNKLQSVEPQTFKVAYSFAAVPARYALERRRWDEAAKLTLPANTVGSFPWAKFGWAEAHIHFARAIGFARTGDVNSARLEVEKLAALRDALVIGKGEYNWAKQVEIERQIAASWLAFAENKREESLNLMRAAADLDDATDKHPVTPGAILPAREQLGELLLELKQPAAALTEFETSLRTAPQRFNGLYGAARAATLAADQKKARTYYEKLLALTQQADTPRPEIAEAKAFLAMASKR